MKRKALTLAISSIVLAGFAQSSQATPYNFYMAGSSAQDSLVMTEAAKLCLNDGKAVYYVDNNFGANTSGFGNNYKALTCTPNATLLGSPFNSSTDTITFYKTNLGGSAQGVDPLWNSHTVPALNIGAGSNCSANAAVTLPAGLTGTGQVCSVANANTDTNPASLNLGVSDVNPAMFQGVNKTITYNPNTGAAITTFGNITHATAPGVTVVTGPALIWGVPVTQNLYVALQAAQGLLSGTITDSITGHTISGGTCSPLAYSSATSADGCMPSLNKSQITSLLTGTIYDWSQLYFTSPNSGNQGVNLVGAATGYASGAYLPSGTNSSTQVYMCQRTAGSGTAASQYAYFLNQPANENSTQLSPIAEAPQFGTIANGSTVFSTQDGGNMEQCLWDLATGPATPAAVNYAGQPIDVAGTAVWAFGQLASNANANGSSAPKKGYRFVKLNGVAPTLANAFSGAYDFVNESTWQYPTNTSGAPLVIVNALIKAMQNPATNYNDLDAGAVQQFGAAGFMTTYANAVINNASYSLPNQVDPLNPVTPWTRNTQGSAVANTLDNGSPQELNLNSPTAP